MGSHSCQCTIHTNVIFLISHISMSFARYVLQYEFSTLEMIIVKGFV